MGYYSMHDETGDPEQSAGISEKEATGLSQSELKLRQRVAIAVHNKLPGAGVRWDREIGVENKHPIVFKAIDVGFVDQHGNLTWDRGAIDAAQDPARVDPDAMSAQPAPTVDASGKVTIQLTRADAMYWLAFADERFSETEGQETRTLRQMRQTQFPTDQQRAMQAAFRRKANRLARLGEALATGLGEEF